MQTVEAALTDVINNKFGGPTGFDDWNIALVEIGVSPDNPIRFFRKPIGSSGDARAAAANPDVIVYDSWFLLNDDPTLQEALLGHEMAHYWDQEHGGALTTEMKGWINWGDTATDRGSHADVEDIAEAVRVYFWPQYGAAEPPPREWTDDMGIVFEKYDWITGPDQLTMNENQLGLPVSNRKPTPDSPIQVQDRYDWLQWKFTGTWLTP